MCPGVDGDELRSGSGVVFLEENPGCLHGREARLAQSFLSAVVKENVGGAVVLLVAGDASFCAGCDFFCGSGLPIVSHDVPLDRR